MLYCLMSRFLSSFKGALNFVLAVNLFVDQLDHFEAYFKILGCGSRLRCLTAQSHSPNS